jgi:hypothetical protein
MIIDPASGKGFGLEPDPDDANPREAVSLEAGSAAG